MKYYFWSTVFAFLLLSTAANAQCPPGDLTFISQAQLDAFATNYPNCTQITGNLLIGYVSGSGTTNITDLSPLQNIFNVTGGLDIRNNPNLATLSGLENITTIGDYVVVNYNASLVDTQGLSALQTIGGNMEIMEILVWKTSMGLAVLPK